ncbi:hypothetical protein ACHQM5_008620 [Ranunculus cassubicifolius]
MARLSFIFALSFCLLVLFHGSQARQQQSQRQRQCQVQNIDALEPTHRVQSEAGVTEHWDENNEQLDCAGVSVTRHVIQPRGLLLPHFHNTPKLTYIIQGRAVHGVAIPGCPETYQQQSSEQQSQSEREQGQSQQHQSREREWESERQSQRQGRDQHQKVRQVRQGDIVAVPVGVPNWFYNDGETPLIMVTLLDTSNNENQLDRNQRAFYLGGNPQQERQEGSQSPRRGSQQQQQHQQQQQSNNIFNGFDEQMLAEAFGVSTETARKLRGENDRRGNIVRVENELQVIRPPRRQEEQRQQGQEQQEQEGQMTPPNGLEESLCNIKLRINVDNPSRTDVYNPRAGRINRVNSRKLSILRLFKLNVERGVLYRNALVAPHWNLNSHSVIYVTRGNARVQIVGNYQQPIYDGQLRQGQLLVVPQNFAVVKRAGDQGFEWIAFKTNDQAVTSPVAGRNSVIRALPEEILMNAFRISSEQARRLKFNRQEVELFAPNSQFSQERD